MRKAVVMLVLVSGLIIAAPAGATSSLVGSWHFNEDTGTAAGDSSGFANNGTASGAAQWVPGLWGSALSFDGATGRVQCFTT